MNDLSRAAIAKFDNSGMALRIINFPEQLRQAKEIATSNPVAFAGDHFQNICIAGMGGSAIGGDIVHSYLLDSIDIPITVNRFYDLPNFINQYSLVIVCSYSGNTEESLSAYQDACARGAQIVCITSGGELEQAATRNSHQVIKIPGGNPPRSALGYLAVPILYCLHALGKTDDPGSDLDDTITTLQRLAETCAPDVQENEAKRISQALYQKIPLILSSDRLLDSVAQRWKCQLCENSEVLAFHNFFPELNHNEIVGWGPLEHVNKSFQVIYLQDRADHHRVKLRMQISKSIIEQQTGEIIEVKSRGDSLLSRIFSLILMGDFVSLYLAVLNRVDPTEINNINMLKRKLSLG